MSASVFLIDGVGALSCKCFCTPILLLGAFLVSRSARVMRCIGFGLALSAMMGLQLAQQIERVSSDEFWDVDAKRTVVITAHGKKASQYVVRDATGHSSSSALLTIRDVDSLRRGDLLQSQVTYKRPSAAVIDGLFDYEQFLRRRGISHTAYARSTEVTLIEQSDVTMLQSLRSTMADQIERLYPREEQAAIVSAFLLGDRSALAEDTQESFRRTGAMHILAVSGLHVGAIAVLMMWLSSRLLPGDRYRHVRGLMTICVIVLFMALTGFSASVSRSGLMFCIYILSGLAYGRRRSGINSLCLAAVILLLIEPYTLYDVGFQYSFAAVLGILLFMPWMKDLWPGGSPVVKFLKGTIMMSIAAQVLIVPLSLLYFGEVSTLGIISSVVAVPAAAAIMYLSLGSVIVGIVYERLAMIVADVLSLILDWLFAYITWLSEADFALYIADYFDASLTILWCIGVASAYLYFVQGIKRFRYVVIASIMLFSLYSWHCQLDHRDDLYAITSNDRWGNETSEIWYQGHRYSTGLDKSSWALDRVADDMGFGSALQLDHISIASSDLLTSLNSGNLSENLLQDLPGFTAISHHSSFTIYKYEEEN